MKLLEIPEIKKICVIDPSSILRVQAHSSYSKIYFVNKQGTMLVSKVLAWVEEKLPQDMFLRVHRSHLVNRLYIKDVKGVQHKTLELMNGELVTVSRRKRTAFGKAPFL